MANSSREILSIRAKTAALTRSRSMYDPDLLQARTDLEEAKLNTRDSALAQELAFSTIRWQLTYDFILNQVSSRPVDEIDASVLNALRLGCHQLLKMRIPPHAAINETVNLIRAVVGEKAVGFANGVLRRVSEKSFDQWIDIAEGKAKSKIEFLSIQ